MFAGLIDDAAMFPPGNASAARAVADHLRFRGSGIAEYVGPLLVHQARLPEVMTALTEAAAVDRTALPLRAVLIGATSVPDLPADGLDVVGVETPVDGADLPEAGLAAAYEIPASAAGIELISAIANLRRRGLPVSAKLRTGGTSAEAFPTGQQVAAVIAAVVTAGCPLKFTAGLHHAVRHTDETTGFEHHGFLNLLIAVHVALRGGQGDDLAAVIEQRRAQELVDAVRSWDSEEDREVRQVFTSFGCCGVEEPIADLAGLGLAEVAVLRR